MSEPLKAEFFHAVVNAAFDKRLLPEGFEPIRHRRRWVRSAKTPIRELFGLYTLKGLSTVPFWGFGLDFVPDVQREDEIHWHRTAKSSPTALAYDPIDFTRDVKEWRISVFQSADSLRINAESIAEKSVRQALDWFSKVQEVADLPRAFEEERRRPFVRFGFDNYPNRALAYAFTLAKLGRAKEGRKWLRRYVETMDFSNTGAGTLEGLLLKVSGEE